MNTRKVSCNREWTVITIAENSIPQYTCISYNEVQRITLDKCMESKFFKKVPSEKIQIFTTRVDKPVFEISKLYHNQYFEEYKLELEKFSKDNKIPFINNIEL